MNGRANNTQKDLRLPPGTSARLAPPLARGRVHCGTIDMRIDRDGIWHYRGSPIHRKALVRLFARALVRDTDGDFWLVTPAEMGLISVEDAPFLAVELALAGEGAIRSITFRTNVDDFVAASPAHPIRVAIDAKTGEPSPYVMVRDGLEARLTRPVFYELAGLAEPALEGGRQVLGVWSGGAFFPLGPAEAPPP